MPGPIGKKSFDVLSFIPKLDVPAPSTPLSLPNIAPPPPDLFGPLFPGLNSLLKPVDPKEVAAAGAESTVSVMSDSQLIKLAEQPGGQQTLEAAKAALKGGAQTPARAEQLRRLEAATFTPGTGLTLEGSEENKASYLHMIRQTMLQSQSAGKEMQEVNNGSPPVKLKIERDTGTKLDSFNNQIIDVGDLEKLPAEPKIGNSEGVTRGEVLMHAMREQRFKAREPNGPTRFEEAHTAAINAENDFRRDLGQGSFRKLPPGDETRIDLGDGQPSALIVHFDDGHDEAMLFDAGRNLIPVDNPTDVAQVLKDLGIVLPGLLKNGDDAVG